MRYLVTGVAGFVGSNIARSLLMNGHEVVGIDAMTDYYDVAIKRRNLASLQVDYFTFVEDDLNSADVESLLDGVDVIFHQAGQPGVRKSWGRDFDIYTEANVNATQKLLEGARNASGLKRLVYASSSSIYGDAESFPTKETDRPAPLSPYGVTKLAAEHMCTLYAKNFGLPTVSLRYFTVYGPGQRPDMAFTRFVKSVVRDEEITVFGSGEQIRDFTFIDDVVQANLLAGGSDCEPGSVFNVAGGSSVSVNDVLDILAELNGSPLRVTRTEKALGDVFRTGGSTEAITAALGWMPKVDVREGLKRHLAWGRDVF
ncbi:NAD-dependent epimerase/dehydratase family protein [Subtercola sp. YIM 133946]|uniref:NAD-dependent epimerase/dehydratase family protein n=1 Tax=Subtercola sp. YIM 133946 TaxID=3118909 RepID=UPI002F92EAC9